MEKNLDIRVLFARYRNRQATPAEETQLLELIRSGEQAELFRTLVAESLASQDRGDSISDQAVTEAVDTVYAEIQRSKTPAIRMETMVGEPLRNRISHWWGRVAATAIITAVGCWGIIEYVDRPQLVTLSVPLGKTYSVKLPDSSTVALNGGTTIRYRDPFADDRRHVILKNGQAFFDVRWHPNRPFVVETDDLDVTVLGTSFEIKGYADEPETRVSVATGRVSVSTRKGLDDTTRAHILSLSPHQQLVYDREQGRAALRSVSEAFIAPWRENQLAYNEERLDVVLRDVARKYKTPIKIENPGLAERRITGVIGIAGDASLAQVLEMLSTASSIRYRFEQDTLVVR